MMSRFSGLLDRRAKLLLSMMTGAAATAFLYTNFVDASPPGGSVVTEAQIAKLTSCYAHGTDAIGRGELQSGKDI